MPILPTRFSMLAPKAFGNFLEEKMLLVPYDFLSSNLWFITPLFYYSELLVNIREF